MTKQATKKVNIMNLVVGNIIHFHGARFEITTIRIINISSMHDIPNPQRDTVMCANGKWLDGNVVNGYFGPNKDWGFQGNSNVSHEIEI